MYKQAEVIPSTKTIFVLSVLPHVHSFTLIMVFTAVQTNFEKNA